MPTTISAISQDYITMRFKEAYVSRGLNQKLYGIVGSGVVRGGKLATTGAGFGVFVLKDPTATDMIFSYQDANGLQFTIRLPATQTLDLTAFANTTIYICLYVEYSIGATTIVEWRKYTEAEMLAAPDVIVLGKVVVPAAGPIPAANVTPTARRMAWDDKAPEGWHQCVKNGGFEQAVAAGNAETSGEVEHWYGLEGGSPFYQISTAAPYSGTREFQLEETAALALTQKIFRQSRRVRVTPGQYVRGRVRLRGSTWNAGNLIDAAGHQGMALLFYSNDFTLVSTKWIENNALTGTFAYTLLDGIIEVPAGVAWMCVSVGVNNNGAVLGIGSLYFDDVKAWVESEHPIEDIFDLAELSESISAEVLSLIPTAADLPAPVTMAEHIARTLRIYKSGQTAGPVEGVAAGLISGLSWILTLINGKVAAEEHSYPTAKPFWHTFFAATSNVQFTTFTTTPEVDFTDPETVGAMRVKSAGETAGNFVAVYPANLPNGAIVTKIGIQYSSTGGTTGGAAGEFRFTLCKRASGASSVISLMAGAGAAAYNALTLDATVRNEEFTLTESEALRTVDNDMFASNDGAWYLWVAHISGTNDRTVRYHTLWIEYTMLDVAGA